MTTSDSGTAPTPTQQRTPVQADPTSTSTRLHADAKATSSAETMAPSPPAPSSGLPSPNHPPPYDPFDLTLHEPTRATTPPPEALSFTEQPALAAPGSASPPPLVSSPPSEKPLASTPLESPPQPPTSPPWSSPPALTAEPPQTSAPNVGTDTHPSVEELVEDSRSPPVDHAPEPTAGNPLEEPHAQSLTKRGILFGVMVLVGLPLTSGYYVYQRFLASLIGPQLYVSPTDSPSRPPPNVHPPASVPTAIDLVSLKGREKQLIAKLSIQGEAHKEIYTAQLIETYALQHAWYGVDTTPKANKYLRANETYPASQELAIATAYWLIDRGRASEAQQQLTSGLMKPTKQARWRHALGWALSEQAKYEQADKQLAIALRLRPQSPSFLFTRAENAYRAGDLMAAIRHFQQLQKVRATPIAEAYLAAIHLQTSSDLTEPSRWLRNLEAQAPSNLGPKGQAVRLWAVAELALARSDFGAARKTVQTAQRLSSFPPLWSTEARLHQLEHHPDLAITAYEHGLRLTPRYETLYWELAHLELERNPQKAHQRVMKRRASALDRAQRLRFTLFFAKSALYQHKWALAHKHYQRAETQGAKASAYLGFAKLTFAQDRHARHAIRLPKIHRWIRAALRENIEFPEAHDLAGKTLVWSRNLEAAQAAFEEAERWLQRLNHPLPQRLLWYDQVIRQFRQIDTPPHRNRAQQLASLWEQSRKKLAQSYSKETE